MASHEEIHRLFLRALRQRMRVPARIPALALELQAVAQDDPAGCGRVLVLQAWSHAYAADVDQAERTARQALAVLQVLGDVAGMAVARDVLAAVRFLRADYAGAQALTEINLALPQHLRSDFEWAGSYTRMSVVHERLGQPDAALRWHYRSIAAARASGDPACEALELGATGGLQLSLHNTEDASALCDAAWALLHDRVADWTNAWSVVAMNRLMTLTLQGRMDEALPLAETLLAEEHRFVFSARQKRKLLLAQVLAEAGLNDRAQTLLDEARALQPEHSVPTVEWVGTQAQVWQHCGRHQDVVRICDQHQAAVAAGQVMDADMVFDVCRINELLSISHEALGNPLAALQAQRAVTRAERELAGVGMRARRMTLQIQFELETAQGERDAAIRREHEAAEQRTRLAELNHALQLADRAKTRFLAAASHDLRQPIHALGLQLAQLVRLTQSQDGVSDTTTGDATTGDATTGDATPRGTPTQAVADRMGRALGSLTAMFDTLLDISRMDAGAITPQPQALGLRAFLARLAEEFLPLAQAKGLRLVLRVPARAGTVSDPALLESIVRNLLSNAIKYTQRGGVMLAVRARSGGWSLQVWDTGPGIPENEHERIFEEFHRLNSNNGHSTVPSASGLGLGLAIVQRLCGLLGHPLQLRSRAHQGSRFSIQLVPATVPARDAQHPANNAAPVPLRLALIEDDAETREGLTRLLRDWGHQVVAGEDADEIFAALARLNAAGSAPLTHQLDGVIADYRLRAQATGDIEIERLQAGGHPHAAALIITGETAPDCLRSLSDSDVPWLAKPLQHARLRSWLGSVAMGRALTPQ